ncbi:MAG: hypothetical protein N2318_11440, partial [Meiothermus sp.]|nr:hypothetical protein [Meiothermus sp.]
MTPGLLGGIALIAALIFSVLGLVLAVLAYTLRDGRYLEAARRLSTLGLMAALVSFGALEWAILT